MNETLSISLSLPLSLRMFALYVFLCLEVFEVKWSIKHKIQNCNDGFSDQPNVREIYTRS